MCVYCWSIVKTEEKRPTCPLIIRVILYRAMYVLELSLLRATGRLVVETSIEATQAFYWCLQYYGFGVRGRIGRNIRGTSYSFSGKCWSWTDIVPGKVRNVAKDVISFVTFVELWLLLLVCINTYIYFLFIIGVILWKPIIYNVWEMLSNLL